MTLLDAIKCREEILKRIKGARIGVGSNKPGWYDDPHHRSFGKARKRKAEWALKLEAAKEELKKFDALAKTLEVIVPRRRHEANVVNKV